MRKHQVRYKPNSHTLEESKHPLNGVAIILLKMPAIYKSSTECRGVYMRVN